MRISKAEEGLGMPSSGSISFNFVHIICQIIHVDWDTSSEVGTPVWEIRDPPLVTITNSEHRTKYGILDHCSHI